MDPEHLCDLGSDGEDRVERRQRVLEDDGDLRTAHGALLAGVHGQQITSLVADLA